MSYNLSSIGILDTDIQTNSRQFVQVCDTWKCYDIVDNARKRKEPLVQPKMPSFIKFLECVGKRSVGSGLGDAWINSQL